MTPIMLYLCVRLSVGNFRGHLVATVPNAVSDPKFADAIDYVMRLGIGKFRINWHCQCFLGSAFALRKRPGSISKVPKTFLEMHRHRVINLSTDALRLQCRLQLIAIGNTDHIL